MEGQPGPGEGDIASRQAGIAGIPPAATINNVYETHLLPGSAMPHRRTSSTCTMLETRQSTVAGQYVASGSPTRVLDDEGDMTPSKLQCKAWLQSKALALEEFGVVGILCENTSE